LQFLIQALWDLALFRLAKGDCRQGHIGYKFRIEQSEKDGVLLTKIGNLCLFHPIIASYFQIQA
jgi:hypothetical protein